MRFLLCTTIFANLFIAGVSAEESSDANKLTDKADRINYSIGHQIGSDFKRQELMLDETALKQGIADGQADSQPMLQPKIMQSILTDLKKEITSKMKMDASYRIQMKKQEEKRRRDEGQAFMAKNKNREGVVETESGLQYKIIVAGDGAKPSVDDYVTFHYIAKKLDGKEYDNSYKKDKPITSRVNGVLSGFTEAIQEMSTGSKWELYLPPELAYGRQGPLAHQTVIIEVELLSIEVKKQKAIANNQEK